MCGRCEHRQGRWLSSVWLVVQATELVIEFAVHGRVALDPAWSRYGVLPVFGVLIAQLLGNSLDEDITYRAFLFPQMVLHFRNRWGRHGRRAVVVALVVSQGLFAMRHIPIRLLDGSAGVDLLFDLPIVMAIGILLALLYMRTGNLFLVIGVHALIDASTSVVASTVVPPDLLVLPWPWSRSSRGRKPVANASSPGPGVSRDPLTRGDDEVLVLVGWECATGCRRPLQPAHRR